MYRELLTTYHCVFLQSIIILYFRTALSLTSVDYMHAETHLLFISCLLIMCQTKRDAGGQWPSLASNQYELVPNCDDDDRNAIFMIPVIDCLTLATVSRTMMKKYFLERLP